MYSLMDLVHAGTSLVFGEFRSTLKGAAKYRAEVLVDVCEQVAVILAVSSCKHRHYAYGRGDQR